MNKRRNIILALGASALIVPFGSFAQQSGKLVRVAIFERTSAEKYRALEKIFVDTLSELGWVEGRNIVYDRVYADDDVRRIPALAAALVKRNPDLIYTITFEPAREAFAATRTIPIVNGSESRWIKNGWAKTLAHPGGNMTGIANIGNELGAKRLQLLKQALPKITRVGVLMHPNAPQTIEELKLIERAAKGLRVTVVSAPAKQPAELEAAFASFAKNRVEAVLVTHTQLFLTEVGHLVALASKYRMPLFAHRGEMTDAGALMSYSSVLTEQLRRAAHIADKILKGAKPGDIPIELPTRFELVVNQRTAKALGIKIPGEVMLQTTRVIE